MDRIKDVEPIESDGGSVLSDSGSDANGCFSANSDDELMSATKFISRPQVDFAWFLNYGKVSIFKAAGYVGKSISAFTPEQVRRAPDVMMYNGSDGMDDIERVWVRVAAGARDRGEGHSFCRSL